MIVEGSNRRYYYKKLKEIKRAIKKKWSKTYWNQEDHYQGDKYFSKICRATNCLCFHSQFYPLNNILYIVTKIQELSSILGYSRIIKDIFEAIMTKPLSPKFPIKVYWHASSGIVVKGVLVTILNAHRTNSHPTIC